jgi:hypothetical protein
MADASKTYVVECYMPGVDDARVREAADRAAVAVRSLGGLEGGIEYLGALLMAVDEVVLHAFHARDAEIVSRAAIAAGLPFERVIESVEVLPAPLIKPGARPSTPLPYLLEPKEVPS